MNRKAYYKENYMKNLQKEIEKKELKGMNRSSNIMFHKIFYLKMVFKVNNLFTSKLSYACCLT